MLADREALKMGAEFSQSLQKLVGHIPAFSEGDILETPEHPCLHRCSKRKEAAAEQIYLF
jgi:hypothetical protein